VGDEPTRADVYGGGIFGLMLNIAAGQYDPVDLAEEEEFMPRTASNSKQLATPVGPFSHRAAAHGFTFLSGQVGQDPATGALVAGGIRSELRQIFLNCETLLQEMGASFDDVVKVNVFLISMADFAAMNEAYAARFKPPYPARTTVAVQALPMGAHVEMEMIVARH